MTGEILSNSSSLFSILFSETNPRYTRNNIILNCRVLSDALPIHTQLRRSVLIPTISFALEYFSIKPSNAPRYNTPSHR